MHDLYLAHRNERLVHGKYLFDHADKLRAYELYFLNNKSNEWSIERAEDSL